MSDVFRVKNRPVSSAMVVAAKLNVSSQTLPGPISTQIGLRIQVAVWESQREAVLAIPRPVLFYRRISNCVGNYCSA